ncbi:MAG: hypothetical protein ACTSXC_02560 [Candidatus Freyarchaeota archaeon]
MQLEDVIRAALGELKADIVLKDGEIINVFTRELERADVAIKGDIIVYVGDADEHVGENTKVLNVKGMHLSLGFSMHIYTLRVVRLLQQNSSRCASRMVLPASSGILTK